MRAPRVGGPGHDHGAADAPRSGDGPQRLPDGSLFLPKPAQRQIGVRTLVTEIGEHARAYELAGRIVMDPNSGGRVQATLAGRLEPGPGGFPALGQTVKRGQVLAWVVPTAGSIERSNQVATLADLRAILGAAERRLERHRELADTVPREQIETGEAEVASLRARIAALSAGLVNRDALTAPASGVIASANAFAGQVVDARELVFEVVDPARLRVEALAYDAGLTGGVAGASLMAGEVRVPLVFVGAGRALREQALPLAFRAEGAALAQFAIGQPVKIAVRTRQALRGIALPSAALVRNAANETVVWVKTGAERYAARSVRFEPLDGTRVTVVAGLTTSERVVVSGASLVNQIR
ncbi:MAG: HlyD family efflux transporter periplasmic adaptor subunit [Betaproteobacteria bacterium]|nr:HlyD family efflux transporter periplasmic adaptor subunit [Betaproteobacteria bacterium]